MTAVPNWTGRLPVVGRPLAQLFALWAAGRAAMLAKALAPSLADAAWPRRVREVVGEKGVDVILDLVGGPYLEGNHQILAAGGRHIVVGVTGGARAEVDLRALMTRRASMRGTVLRARPLEEKVALTRAFEERALPLFADGRVRPVVDRIVPAAEAAEAHRLLEGNETFGKVLLRW